MEKETENISEREIKEREFHEMNMEIKDAAHQLVKHINELNPMSGRYFTDEELNSVNHPSELVERDIEADLKTLQELAEKRREIKTTLHRS